MAWYRPLVEQAASQFHLDPNTIHALVIIESSGLAHAYRYEPGFWDRYLKDDDFYKDQEPHRVSASYGLCQVMYPTARQYGYEGPPEGLFIPEVSLLYGCQILASHLEWSGGDIRAALAAYNGGRRGNRQPPYRNRGYVAKVEAAYFRQTGRPLNGHLPQV